MFDPAQSSDPVQIPQTDAIQVTPTSSVPDDSSNLAMNSGGQTISPPTQPAATSSEVTDEQLINPQPQAQAEVPTNISTTDLSQIADSLEKDAEQLAANTTEGSVDETSVVQDLTQTQADPNNPDVTTSTEDAQPSEVSSSELPTNEIKPSAITQPQDAPGIDPDKTYTNVVEALKDTGAITQEEANQVLVDNVSTGKSFDAILEDNKFASEEQLTLAKSVVNRIPFIRISEYGNDPQALTQIPEGVAKNYGMLPLSFDKENNSLIVAMRNPLDLSAIDFAEQKSGLKIIAHYAMPSELERKIAENYSQSLSSEVTAALEQTSQVAESKAQKKDLSSLSGETIRQAPITKIVQTVVAFAMKARASDIHIEPQEQRTRVRYRIDGILVEKLILPRSVHEAVVSRIKILSGLKIDEKRIPQDGRFNFHSGGAEVDLRVSTLPTIHGEKIVMRLLKKDASVPALEELGLTGVALSRVKDAIKVPHGIVLVTGPTGSGKTTTLYSVLHTINTPKVNIMTLEDPVEYQMAGINQVQINPQAGLTFASGLRSFLRQDPNIIMVGEIRDSETAELAIQASLTGHLVFSTLHTSSAAGAIPRLLDMGAEPFLLASSMTLTMAQRVVRKINEKYIEEYKPEPTVIEDIKKVMGKKLDDWMKVKGIKSAEDIILYRAKKERPQTEPEYKGRVAIFEVMPVSEPIGKLILERKPATEMEKIAEADGMLFMKQDGYIKALEGLTTIEEVLRVAEI